MEKVFEQLVADRSVSVQGTHWAALINAWGCVQKDLDKALAIFDSIATHPSTKQSSTPMPDAVVYEALINTLVTVRRMDLVPMYLERLQSGGVHMTAYIANLLIKGYASVNEIERSREIFESLQDPQEGVAAPHNHAPHQNKQSNVLSVPAGTPVYREVSFHLFVCPPFISLTSYTLSLQPGKPWSVPNLATANAIVPSHCCSDCKRGCSPLLSTSGSVASCSMTLSRLGHRQTRRRRRALAFRHNGVVIGWSLHAGLRVAS